jgi:hypothetical protein
MGLRGPRLRPSNCQKSGSAGIEQGTSGYVARKADNYTTETVSYTHIHIALRISIKFNVENRKSYELFEEIS